MAQFLVDIEPRLLRNVSAVLWLLFVGLLAAAAGKILWLQTESDIAVAFGAAAFAYVEIAYGDLCIFIFKL